ncbi:MAG TPA: ATP-binding protein [Chitinophagales bacterium]|nr:ATP-binding protein [Chitinophagales bacterium]
MNDKIRVLINEDNKGDVILLLNELSNSGLNMLVEVVQTQADFEQKIKEFEPDIILSDYSQPFLDGVTAFNVKQQIAPQIPFILVSGTLGEEVAVDLIKSGVVDYVVKSRLFSLVPKIKRALAEAKEKQEKQQAQNELLKFNAELEERVARRTAELTEANQALEAFSYSVSHDLRAPLRSIIGFAKIIQTEHRDSMNADALELFEYIEKSSKRMSAIIDDLFKLAKFGKEKLVYIPIDMNELVSSVWDNILFSAPHKAKLEIAGKLPVVVADSSMIEQVLVNLFSNAIKYSSKKESPVVIVGCNQTDKDITIYIRDNGAGFDMASYDRLFGAFQRLHGAKDFEGIGLGLLLVKRIVERHNGSVRAEGVVNEGATFYFTLPIV